jgi:heptosyltransferase-2
VFLQVLGEGFDPTPRLHISIPGRKRNGFWLAIHPGSGSERKNWPQDRWRTLLLSLCTQTDLRFLLIGGEAEQGRLQRLASHLPAERFEIADDWPLPELAAAITRCAFFIGHDSGIGHLAAALGLPGLILWGPSNPVIWRPRSDKMQLLQAPNGLAQLAESTVEKALFRLFPALDF